MALDSLFAAHSIPIHVNEVRRDLFDWAGLLLAPLAAIGGAVVGARMSAKSAVAALTEQARIDRETKKGQLVQRLRYVLPRMRSFGQTFSASEAGAPLRLDIMHEVVELWAAYDRLSDHGVFLSSLDFDYRARTYLMEAAITARLAIRNEEYDQKLGLQQLLGQSTSRERERTSVLRGQYLNRTRTWAEEGSQLLNELEKQ
jgi:hypothetical protein